MTAQTRLRRIGWLALLLCCTLVYGLLHLQVWSVASDVRLAERRIVELEQNKRLLETEFLTRSSQLQLAAWNRVDFGYSAPRADQFIASERDLAAFGVADANGQGNAPRLAAFVGDEEAPPFPRLVSPITGEPIDEALIRPSAASDGDAAGSSGVGAVIATAAAAAGPARAAPARTQLNAGSRQPGTVRVVLGGGEQ